MDALGPDVLSEEVLAKPDLIERFRKRNQINICKVLMDQKTISGVGNYICSEALYQSRINPYARVINLSDTDIVNLYQI